MLAASKCILLTSWKGYTGKAVWCQIFSYLFIYFKQQQNASSESRESGNEERESSVASGDEDEGIEFDRRPNRMHSLIASVDQLGRAMESFVVSVVSESANNDNDEDDVTITGNWILWKWCFYRIRLKFFFRFRQSASATAKLYVVCHPCARVTFSMAGQRSYFRELLWYHILLSCLYDVPTIASSIKLYNV